MQPHKLSPLPSVIPAEDKPAAIRGECGFVDEAVVRALMAGPAFTPVLENERAKAAAKGTALDFAGWSLPTPAVVTVIPENARRPGPPVLSEPGLGEPHRGPHRWWLAGMAGATCSLLFTVLLIHLTTHVSRESENFITIRANKSAPAGTQTDDTARKAILELTRLQENNLPPPVTRD
jgi:hypothetical protein